MSRGWTFVVAVFSVARVRLVNQFVFQDVLHHLADFHSSYGRLSVDLLPEVVDSCVNLLRPLVVERDRSVLLVGALRVHWLDPVLDCVGCPLFVVVDQARLYHQVLYLLVDQLLLFGDNLARLVDRDLAYAFLDVDEFELLLLIWVKKGTVLPV